MLAVRPLEPLWACTPIAVLKVQALASVPTGLAVALPDLAVTLIPCEARLAGTGVAPLARVHTSGPITTWLVMSAIVQILVTEEASPAFFAGALPGLLTGAMFAGWMPLTLITEGALPALSAYTLSWP